jgi:hypothetical protein
MQLPLAKLAAQCPLKTGHYREFAAVIQATWDGELGEPRIY